MSKVKRLWNVTKELLKDPTLTIREVAEKTWVSKSTVANYINEDLDKIGQKDDRILWVCEKDFEIVQLWQALISERLKDKNETDKMRTFEIAQTIEKSEKRYMLFKWTATDKNWWLNSTKDMTTEELLRLASE